MSRRQVAATIVVVALVALAGCSFVTGPSDDGGEETPTPAAETTAPPTETPTATPTATATPTPPPSGDVYEAAISAHRSQLANEDGVVMSLTEEEQADSDTTATGTVQFDLATEERYSQVSMTMDGNDFSFESYSPPNSNRVQTCTFGGDECTFRNNQTKDDLGSGVTHPVTQIAEINEAPDFEDRGVVQTDQGERRKLVAEGTEAVTDASVDYESFRLVLLFDAETGLLQKMVYEATFTQDGVSTEKSLTVEYEYRAVDIEQPDWYIEEDE